jgi:hypothetical protein
VSRARGRVTEYCVYASVKAIVVQAEVASGVCRHRVDGSQLSATVALPLNLTHFVYVAAATSVGYNRRLPASKLVTIEPESDGKFVVIIEY